jgi:putative ABC transport system permease protein
MPQFPVTFLAAYSAPGSPTAAARFDNELVRQFPNITSVDVSSTLNQIQAMLDQVIGAVQFLFAFTLAAGMVVLFAAVSAAREERARDFAVMRAVGASGHLLRQIQQAELLGVGFLAGFLASALANAVGWALAHFVFDFAWQPSWLALLGGSLLGALLAWAAGWWGLRGILQRPVMQTLRQATD